MHIRVLDTYVTRKCFTSPTTLWFSHFSFFSFYRPIYKFYSGLEYVSCLLHVEAQQLSLLIMFIKPKKWCIHYVSVQNQHPRTIHFSTKKWYQTHALSNRIFDCVNITFDKSAQSNTAPNLIGFELNSEQYKKLFDIMTFRIILFAKLYIVHQFFWRHKKFEESMQLVLSEDFKV